MSWLPITIGHAVLWLWVTRAILENDRVEDFSADHAAPPREGRHAGTDLQIHECLFHQKIVTAWASHHEVGFVAHLLIPLPSRQPLEASLMQQIQQEGQAKFLP